MLCGGIHPKVVQELLGHASVTVTLDTYSHVRPVMQGEAAVKMDSMLTPGWHQVGIKEPRSITGVFLYLHVCPANCYKIEVARPGFEPGTP
jgi:hypothetical protein